MAERRERKFDRGQLMGQLFSSPKTVKTPVVPEAEAIPEIGIDTEDKTRNAGVEVKR